MMRRVLLALALLGGGMEARAQPVLSIAPDAPVETVFRWNTQRCTELHVPDSPARALRMSDGGIALWAAHLVNIPMRGRDFDSLVPVCEASSRGAEMPDPAAFQDRFWVQAVVPFTRDGRRHVLGLASHEYMGWRHPGQCTVPFDGADRRPAGFRCWYSAITAVIAEERDLRFRAIPAPRGIIAASPFAFDPMATHRTGFFSVSNAIVAEGHVMVMVYTEGVAGQPRGNCLLRAPLDALPDGWRSLAQGGFTAVHPGPGNGPHTACEVVGNAVFGGAPVRALLRFATPDGPWWLAVFTRAAPRDRRDGASDGVFTSASRDLRQWTPATRLWAMTPFRSQPEAGVYYEYPALIDHASTSVVFDTVEGAPRLHLYLTRLNLQDRRRGLDRDLVRIAVRVGGG